MMELVKLAYLGSETLQFLNSTLASGDTHITARGLMVDQVHFFDKEILEQIKADIANYLRKIGIESFPAANNFLANINTIEDLENLNILIAAITAAGFIENSTVDAFRNLDMIGESNYSYFTAIAIDYAKKGIISKEEFIEKINSLLGKIHFLVKKENIENYASKQK